MYWEHLSTLGVKKLKTHPLVDVRTQPMTAPTKPNIVVLGVGHSGTSILVKLLFALGWKRHDADVEFGESVAIREINERFNEHGEFVFDQAQRVCTRSGPWAIKDPRFIATLPKWISAFVQLDEPPFLFWVQRDPEQVAASYIRRGEMPEGTAAKWIAERTRMARWQFKRWPWSKATIAYEDLMTAASLLTSGSQ